MDDGQRIKLAGQGEPGRGGAPAGDLYVKVHVTPHRVFGRSKDNPDDLVVTVPVTYPELVLGSTIDVPTLDGSVTLRIPAGNPERQDVPGARPRRAEAHRHAGNLLVTVSVAVPQRLDDAAQKALHDFAEATKGFDPRADLL